MGSLAVLLKHRAHALSKIKKQRIRSSYVDRFIHECDTLKDIHRRHQRRYAEIKLPLGHHGDPYSTLLYCNREISKVARQLINVRYSPITIDFPKLISVRGQ